MLIAEEEPVAREGMRRIFAVVSDLKVLGEAGDGETAAEMARSMHPDVVIIGIGSPGIGGVIATRRIRAADERTKVLVLATRESPEMFFALLEAGATGFLLKKDATGSELLKAVHSIHQEGVYLPPKMAQWLVAERRLHSRPGVGTAQGGLTPRQEEILKLVAEGHSNQAIAGMTRTSPATVQTHRAKIMKKLGLHSRADLIKYAISRGLIHLEEQH